VRYKDLQKMNSTIIYFDFTKYWVYVHISGGRVGWNDQTGWFLCERRYARLELT